MTQPIQTMTPQQFISRWSNAGFGERQGAQSFFNDLCGLIGHETPSAYGDPDRFTFEKPVSGGLSADAYFEDRFVWEFKGRDVQLNSAVLQAVGYARLLKNPPLIVVSSFDSIRIETHFQDMELVQHNIALHELDQPEKLELLSDVFRNPDALRPDRSISDVTQDTAKLFSEIVSYMEGQSADPEMLALHLNRIIFCLYAEDAGLLPEGLFASILYANLRRPDLSNRAIANLFAQMAEGGLFGTYEISHFNGDLFGGETPIELSSGAMQRLGEAVKANWRSIEPSIFGTLFERALDASKRTQTGTHYTGADDIALVVEPVVMAPLRREWEQAKQEVNDLLDEVDGDGARARLEAFRDRLVSVRVLDPACGSGNFLYIALRLLLDLEREVIDYAAEQGWYGLTPRVQPNQMLGLEINHYAAELARTALWIGYIQWHLSSGFPYTQRPILTPLDTIRQTDAILDVTDPEHPVEPEWPAAEFIIGNPPFLGHVPFRESLGDDYVAAVYELYGNRIPNSSDLCCYWLEKARGQIETGATKRAGLLATQAIRFQSNRPVLTRIKETGDIFSAISDKDWVLEGAAVRISIICFDDGTDSDRSLDGALVSSINGDLTAGTDLTRAQRLRENSGIAFQGIGKVGDFDIPKSVSDQMMAHPNPHGRPNSDVLKRWINGIDITRRSRDVWIIDFGVDRSQAEASLYEAPFEHVKENVMPTRVKNNMRWRAENWWLHGYPATTMRQALAPLSRYIGTPKVAKHRFFVWLTADMLASNLVIAIASDDDYIFGVLQSSVHTTWALAVGSQLEDRPTYTPTTCFETFPFPRPTEEQREAIGAAAAELNSLREGWLNPPGISAAELRKRTLTNLYNKPLTWLTNAHAKLDAAVADAYGWPADLAHAEILERLLRLNLERAEAQAAAV